MLASKNIHILLLVSVLSIISASVHKKPNVKNETVAQVEHIFKEIEEDHDKLKKVFEDVILKETVPDISVKHDSKKEQEDCICVPFYLCERGSIVRDGSWLLQSRANINECENIQDICCSHSAVKSRKLNTTATLQCGYISKTLEVSDDDKSPDTIFGESPWTVMILVKRSAMVYTCVGSLIHPQVVLTAAHCVNTTETYIVRAGEWNVRQTSEPLPHQNRNIKTIIKHPKFKLHNLFYDAALLVLAKPFELDEHIHTICLAESAPEQLITDIGKCITTGWGRNKPEASYSSVMKKQRFSLIQSDKCQVRLRATRLGYYYELHQSFICAEGQDGLDACEGNGGGPLICPISGQIGRFQQVGITSWGISCADENPTIFAKIAQIKDWIDEAFDDLQYSKDLYTYDKN